MTPDLDRWLQQATHGLSAESTAQVRAEIQDHYASAREAASERGASQDEADQMALSALGDPKIANRQYRHVLLTAPEARLLRQSNEGPWLARPTRPISWRQWLLLAVSLIGLLAIACCFWLGWIVPGRVWLLPGLGLGLIALAPFLPIYTRSRSRIFRYVRWMLSCGIWWVVYNPYRYNKFISGILVLCFIWEEWKRATIRRKLPAEDWPRHLYL